MFTVMICTYNRHDILDQALRSIVDGTDEKPDEVVVVNGGDERADEVVQSYVGKTSVDVRLIKTVNVNLATNRNVGLEHCRGDIVAMTDDDAEVFPNWVTEIKRAHAEYPDAGAIGGEVIGAISDTSLLSRLADIVTFPLPKEIQEVRNLPGVNVTYKREALDAVGKQDVTLFRGEDVDFNWRVKQAGYRVLYVPSIKVIHHHRPSLNKFFKQHYMYGRAYFLVRRKWPEMYAVYPRKLQTPRDFAKGAYFFLSVFYIPAKEVSKMPSWSDRIMGYPILLVNHIMWKWGMIQQAYIETFASDGSRT